MAIQTTDKRTLLVETALQLFYQQGIHAVGINEVLKAAGVAKKTLYSHFASKEELIAATIELRDRRLRGWLEFCLTEQPDGAPAIKAIFTALDDWFNERVEMLGPFRGCFFINASAEYGEADCPIFQRCQQHKLALRQLMLKHCEVVLGPGEEAEQLCDSLVLLKEGAIISAHLLGDKSAALKARDSAQKLIGVAGLMGVSGLMGRL
ncbi:TetR/AcrR family transcriptional regulator [Marinobacterium jannaschii]|uniref:TetR/AcrR family transcriptional regulator n=1 Tax=Marinobacterium jannaschii TaxID=64970 RepID=UPI000486C709|nr:TetR/AcrR family transcriptional regulator [Marinobacterium jannaschii]